MIITVITNEKIEYFELKIKCNELQMANIVKDYVYSNFNIRWSEIIMIKYNNTTLYQKYKV